MDLRKCSTQTKSGRLHHPDPNYICNPESECWILRNGQRGRAILATYGEAVIADYSSRPPIKKFEIKKEEIKKEETKKEDIKEKEIEKKKFKIKETKKEDIKEKEIEKVFEIPQKPKYPVRLKIKKTTTCPQSRRPQDGQCPEEYPIKFQTIEGHDCCRKPRQAALKKLVESHVKSRQEEAKLYFDSRLRIASREGHLELVENLLSLGASPESQDSQGYTALMYAAEQNHFDIVKLLLETGRAHPEYQDKFGLSALMKAASVGHIPVVGGLLVEYGGPGLEVVSHQGWIPLMHAVQLGHIEIVEYLLDHHIGDPGHSDRNDTTALMLAAARGHETIVKMLLKTGQSLPAAKNHIGETAYDLASNTKIENLLKPFTILANLLQVRKIIALPRTGSATWADIWAFEVFRKLSRFLPPTTFGHAADEKRK